MKRIADPNTKFWILLSASLLCSTSTYAESCRAQYLYGTTCTSISNYASKASYTAISKYQCIKNGNVVSKPAYYYQCSYGKLKSAYTFVNGQKEYVGIGRVPDHARARCQRACY